MQITPLTMYSINTFDHVTNDIQAIYTDRISAKSFKNIKVSILKISLALIWLLDCPRM